MEPITSLLNSIFNEASASVFSSMRHNALKKDIEEYVKNLYNKFRYAKSLLFRNGPVDFYSNYIPLTLKRLENGDLINDPLKLIGSFDKIIILGAAGSGKTTFLRYLTLKCIELEIIIPVNIDLRTYKLKNEADLEIFIAKNLTGSEFDLIKTTWGKGKYLFILDGFDEISYAEDSLLIGQIEEFSNKYYKDKFIISSRQGTNVEHIQNFHVFSIQNLNYDDLLMFGSNAIVSNELKERFTETLLQDKSLRMSLSTPMLASLYLLSLENSSVSYGKNSKSVFFRIVLDSLLSKHDAVSKLGYVREKLSGLSKDDLESVATYIAYRMFISSSYRMSKDELNSIFRLVKKNYILEFDNEKLLYDLLVSVNILVEDKGLYFFPHVLILEYLAVLFIVHLDSGRKSSLYSKMVYNDSISISFNALEFFYQMDYSFFIKFYFIPKIENYLLDSTINNFSKENQVSMSDFLSTYFNTRFEHAYNGTTFYRNDLPNLIRDLKIQVEKVGSYNFDELLGL